MNREVALPLEMNGLNINYVRKVSDDELSSSCPFCGGSPHQNGEYPDRFRIFLKSKATGGVLGWCRQCGKKWVPGGKPLTYEQNRAWIEERKQIEERRLQNVKLALHNLREEKRWIEYHNNLIGELRQHYYDRGITDYWIDYWMLGFLQDKIVSVSSGYWHTPAFTIPIFESETQDVLNIRYRLINPPTPHDKYRPEHGIPVPIFITDYERKLSGKTLVVEGEFKAMTTYITLDSSMYNVVGLPGKSPSQYALDQLKECDPIYLCLDPDAEPSVLAEKLGKKRVRIIRLADKIDDMITKKYLGKEGLKILLNTARKLDN